MEQKKTFVEKASSENIILQIKKTFVNKITAFCVIVFGKYTTTQRVKQLYLTKILYYLHIVKCMLVNACLTMLLLVIPVHSCLHRLNKLDLQTRESNQESL